jgi:putative transposase
MTRISFARHRFPPAIIRHTVWLYLRFTLSYRDAENLLAVLSRHWRLAGALNAA